MSVEELLAAIAGGSASGRNLRTGKFVPRRQPQKPKAGASPGTERERGLGSAPTAAKHTPSESAHIQLLLVKTERAGHAARRTTRLGTAQTSHHAGSHSRLLKISSRVCQRFQWLMKTMDGDRHLRCKDDHSPERLRSETSWLRTRPISSQPSLTAPRSNDANPDVPPISASQRRRRHQAHRSASPTNKLVQ